MQKELVIGQPVRFSKSTGNDQQPVYTVSGLEEHNGTSFYTLAGDKGGLYLRSSLKKS